MFVFGCGCCLVVAMNEGEREGGLYIRFGLRFAVTV
jgi:hypothetical protein